MIRFILRLSLLVAALSAAIHLNAQCEYRLTLTDAAADGWFFGSEITVDNGTQMFQFTLVDGASQTFSFPVVDSQQVSLVYSTAFLDEDAGLELIGPEGELLFETNMLIPGVIYMDTAFCPDCARPSDFTLVDVWDTRARFSWNPNSVDPLVGWYLIYGVPGFDPASGEGDTLFTLSSAVTLTGLDTFTRYDIYLQQECVPDTASPFLGPINFRTYRSNDVGISAILTPEGACQLGFESVEVLIKNYGANPQSLINLNYTVNGIPAGVGQPQDGTYTGSLGKDSCELFRFDATFDFTQPGEYVVAAFTEFEDDEDRSNDTFYYYVATQLPAPYMQSFEVWNGGWQVDSSSVNSSWTFGRPNNTLINKAADGNFAWVTGLSTDHNSEERSFLISPCFNFQDLTEDPYIELSIFRDLETAFDGAFLDVSIDDGETWTRVGDVDSGLNWYTENNTQLGLGAVWSGSVDDWLLARHPIPGVAGERTVRLRFGLAADDVFQQEGFGVDDIRVRVPDNKDLAAISATTLGEGTVCGLEQDRVVFTYSNFGKDTAEVYALAYSINGAAPIIDTLANSPILADQVFAYEFDAAFNSIGELIEITCWTILDGEERTANDTFFYSIDHRPESVPVVEGFESGVLPDKWTASSNMLITDGHGNVSNVLSANLFSQVQDFSLQTAVYGPITPGDKLRFDYRITDFTSNGMTATALNPGDRFDLMISGDCGDSLITVYSITNANHTPSTELQTVEVDLDTIQSELLYITFAGQGSGLGNYWFDLDNINIRSCPPSLQLSAEVADAAPGQNNGSATVTVGVGNIPYTYLWSDGQTTQTADSLASGEYVVSVTDGFGCTDTLLVVVGTATGTTDFPGLQSLSIRPNPTQDVLFVNASFDQAYELNAEVYDLLGRKLAETNSNGQELNTRFDLRAYPNGIYLLRITAGGQSLVRKVVKG